MLAERSGQGGNSTATETIGIGDELNLILQWSPQSKCEISQIGYEQIQNNVRKNKMFCRIQILSQPKRWIFTEKSLKLASAREIKVF